MRFIVVSASATARGFCPRSIAEYDPWLILIFVATSA
jgi:hypothetical protein